MTFIKFHTAPNAGPGNPNAVGQMAAEMVRQQLQDKPNSAIVFPTGSTPKPMYTTLKGMNDINWDQARLFHLDEYVSKPEFNLNHDQTFEYYMNQHLWADPKLAKAQKHYFYPHINHPDRYEQELVNAGGADLVILGIGENGHIAFIEPGFNPKTAAKAHRVYLEDSTINNNFPDKANTGYADEAVTLGLDSILSAKKIILLATGEKKKAILEKALGDFNTPPNPSIPASFLKTHPNVTVITDF